MIIESLAHCFSSISIDSRSPDGLSEEGKLKAACRPHDKVSDEDMIRARNVIR